MLFRFWLWLNKKRMMKERDALLNCIKRASSGPYVSDYRVWNLVDKLRDLDLWIFGGCKKKWYFEDCDTCEVSDCPRKTNREFYAALTRGEIYDVA